MKATKITTGTKTFVVVTDADGNEIRRFGGKRAERANWVLTNENWQPFTEPLDYTLQPGESSGGYLWDYMVDPEADAANGNRVARVVYRRLPGRMPVGLRRDNPFDEHAIEIS